jgi:hypothetical protein
MLKAEVNEVVDKNDREEGSSEEKEDENSR